ncbi:MAG: type I restriction enzyme HsdR N-terminal domain-containing protein [Alphaproteobacteria bacterium]|nr:type I restriction enzyme HsdR N-terminal domain-containing protein [Alphaproteobacteria bacterium]
MKIPAKFIKRANEQLKKYQVIVRKLKRQEVNETDTVKVINDIFADLFGYDKYTEITSEYAIRGTFCDLAIKQQSGKIYMLVEAKGVSIPLKENHIKQATDYGVNHGTKWVVLTNSVDWKVYKIKYSQPIERELVFEFNLLDMDLKKEKQLEVVFALSKEGQDLSVIDEIYSNNQVKNKYVLAGVIDSPEIYKLIKKQIKLYFENSIKITDEEISNFIKFDIFKREVWDSDEAKEYQKVLKKMIKKAEKKKQLSVAKQDVQ